MTDFFCTADDACECDGDEPCKWSSLERGLNDIAEGRVVQLPWLTEESE
jgi:hypothetical protein